VAYRLSSEPPELRSKRARSSKDQQNRGCPSSRPVSDPVQQPEKSLDMSLGAGRGGGQSALAGEFSGLARGAEMKTAGFQIPEERKSGGGRSLGDHQG